MKILKTKFLNLFVKQTRPKTTRGVLHHNMRWRYYCEIQTLFTDRDQRSLLGNLERRSCLQAEIANMTRKPKALLDKTTATPSPPTQQTTPPAKTQVASPSAPQKQPLSVVRRISFAEQPLVTLVTYNVAKSLVLSLDVNMHHDLRMKP